MLQKMTAGVTEERHKVWVIPWMERWKRLRMEGWWRRWGGGRGYRQSVPLALPQGGERRKGRRRRTKRRRTKTRRNQLALRKGNKDQHRSSTHS